MILSIDPRRSAKKITSQSLIKHSELRTGIDTPTATKPKVTSNIEHGLINTQQLGDKIQQIDHYVENQKTIVFNDCIKSSSKKGLREPLKIHKIPN
jgi:hypothetical protein